MTVGQDISADVLSLISEYGKSVDIIAVTEGDYDPASGVVSGDSETTQTVSAVKMSYNNREIDGTRIQTGDVKYIVAASGTNAINSGDTLTDDIDYTIVSVKSYEVQGEMAAYVLQCRSGGS